MYKICRPKGMSCVWLQAFTVTEGSEGIICSFITLGWVLEPTGEGQLTRSFIQGQAETMEQLFKEPGRRGLPTHPTVLQSDG